MDCVFCKIIKGEIPSYTLYEDDLIKVFLDINPSTNGDCLIVTKEHYENFLDIPEYLISHIHKISIKMYSILKEKLDIDGLTLIQNNFYGQDIKHYHVHLTPRYKNDKLTHSYNKEIILELKEVFEKIKSA